ncbi:MAG: hypothetical protein JXR48_07265 [Candidatus Delongbacteria bacterium]|nr:hypothetical protein [Candidatus Delongbacteria bacterium]MBN2834750.1 hypothetical protein [Candidatus Delongbacteria bacterium]
MFELEAISNELRSTITSEIQRAGIFFSIFSRIKSHNSISEKLNRGDYLKGKKIQDFIGIRIALYFPDDIDPVIAFLRKKFTLDNKDIDLHAEDTFRPKRLNLVFKLPNNYTIIFNETVSSIYDDRVDPTFEVQIRTLLSEGWHEVEHDLRYKCKEDWEQHKDLSRALNGIYATLETGEWSMLALFNELSYRNYKNKKWESMIRNKLRIRIVNRELSLKLSNFFNQNPRIAKEIYKLDRHKFLDILMNSKISIPLTFDNLIFILNEILFKNEYLSSIEPQFISDEIKSGLIIEE